jgi:4-amino-4-deoxy-L-arabinose transferase-like glycosyltransferase
VRLTPRIVLAAIVVAWTVLGLVIATATPPWEANDEPDHTRNVEQLVAGHWYRIAPGSGFESHQAPLYYFLLAGWQKAFGVPAQQPTLVYRPGIADAFHGNFEHNTPTDGADQRLATLLRLPGVLLGAMTILLAAAIARRLTSDQWTPVVAAAWVAAVPKFAFVSAVVNNDNLQNTLCAAATLVAVIALQRRERGAFSWWPVVALGLLAGAIVATKATAATLLIPLAVVVVLVAVSAPRPAAVLGAFAGLALVVCAWWLIQNQVRYGDPLAATASKEHLKALLPSLFQNGPPLKTAFVTLPDATWKSFWYTSGWNQFYWPWWPYLPLWLGLAAALLGLARPRLAGQASKLVLWVLGIIVFSGMAAFWILGLQTTNTQARVMFMALPAIACLAAIGLERWRLPVLARFALPALGAVLTVAAIRGDIFDIYF